VGQFGIVVFSSAFDGGLGFTERVEDLSVKQSIAQACIEALTLSGLPRRAWFDVGGPGSDGFDPVPDGLSNEL